MPTGTLHFRHTVTIDGGDLAGITLAGATINYGTRNPDEPPTPANAYLTLISADAVPNIGPAYPGFSWGAGIPSGFTDDYRDQYEGGLPRINVGVPVSIDATTPTGFVDAYVDTYDGGFETPRFTGIITAIDVLPGSVAITAVTLSESLTRIQIDPSGWAAENDVNRFLRIVQAAGLSAAEYTVVGARTTDIAEKGITESPVSAWELLTEVAASANAVLFTNRNGVLVYQSRTVTGTTTELSPAATLLDDFQMVMELGEIANVVTVEMGAADNRGAVTVQDAASIAAYGKRDRTYSTVIEGQVSATEFANRMLAHYKDPFWRMPTATVNLRLSEAQGVFPGYLQEILTVDLDDSVHIPHLLPASPLPSYTSRVLGYQEVLDPYDWSITFALNPAGWSKP
jgi:hypothetical protein